MPQLLHPHKKLPDASLLLALRLASLASTAPSSAVQPRDAPTTYSSFILIRVLRFFSGRAPCGKRTNWVMHEYQLTDEELAKEGISLDSYLLCKILKKSGPGFKPGEQYGPFIEEELDWDQQDSVLVPGEEAEDDTVGNIDSRVDDSVHSINTSEGPIAAAPPPTEAHAYGC